MKYKQIYTNNIVNDFKIINFISIHKKQNISKLMLWVIIAIIPGIVCQIYFFGNGIIYQILLSIITAFICESIALALRKLSIINHLKDNSALVTALLLAISIPPLSPWWLVTLGTIFAILIAKHIYGGLGQNPFNPAMIGYVAILISFPIQMTNWLPQIKLKSISTNALTDIHIIFNNNTISDIILDKLTSNFDSVTQPTPLCEFKDDLLTNSINKILKISIKKDLINNINWKLVNIAYLFGGIIMLNRKIISWQIPIAFLTTLFSFSLISWLIMPLKYASPIIHLFSGATMIGAFFISTDPVTSATTPRGQLIYGAIVGSLIWIIRTYGSYPDAVAFAVLLGNITVPIIDYYNKPRIYGYK
ncbi:MAG: electron transport complex subunit RsxD [Arsenophonus endosymbiont of Ceratovacuna japonica]